MSTVGMTRSEADAVLKDFYLPGVRSLLNNKVFMLAQVEQNSEDVEGRAAVLSINTGRNQGVGARAELGPLPTAGRQRYAEQRVNLKYNYGRIQVSGPVMRSTGSDRGSFVRSVQSETQGIVRDLRNDVNRQCYGDGTGALITISGANTGATFPVANATDAQLRHIEADMVVDIGSPAAPAAKGFAAVVDSVDRVNKTITLAGVVAVAANDVVFRTGSGGTGALQKEITGLKGQIAATGALWNIDPADHPRWASSVFTGAGAISEDMFIEASQTVNIESGEQIDLWVTTMAIQRATANLFTSLRRFNTPTELKGGYTGLDMSDVSQADTGSNTASMVYDKDMAEDGVAYGLTTSKFQNYKMSDWEFMQDDGAILSRVPNADAYEATLFCYNEMATDARNAHTKISGITTA